MKSPAAILSALVILTVSACSPNPSPVSPSSSPTTPLRSTGTLSSDPQPITVGETARGTWTEHGALDDYELTAPSDGTLVVSLTWSSDYSGVDLKLADKWISRNPPVVATLAVKSGQRYRLTVADRYAWDYDRIFVEYVVTTAME
jgi:hypothetical protein